MPSDSTVLRSIRFAALLVALAIASATGARASPPPPDSLTEEISLQIHVDRLGTTVVPALYLDGDVYLPLLEIFRFLEVKAVISNGGRVVTGFFIDEENLYSIDIEHRIVTVGSHEWTLDKNEAFTTETEIFLRRKTIVEVFDIECAFNFRTLSVRISSSSDFPALRLQERLKVHQGLDPDRHDSLRIDKEIGRSAGVIRFGVIDWVIGSSRSQESHDETYSLGVGGEFLGGDIHGEISGTTTEGVKWKDVAAQWRFADPDGGILTQVIYGRGITPPIPGGYGLIDGLLLTNRPITHRRAFGSYVVTGRTEPGWIIDVYVDHALVTFTLADGSGHYEVPIPLRYGSTTITLKFFGPWGEERTYEQIIRVPYTFLPSGEVEFSVAGGVSHDEISRWVGQGSLQVGVLPDLTLGGGAQYIKRWNEVSLLPYATASLRLGDGIVSSVEFIRNYRISGHMSYLSASGQSVEGSYQRFYRSESFGNTRGDLNKGRLSLASPFRFGPVMGSAEAVGTYETGGAGIALNGIEANLGVAYNGFSANYNFRGIIPSGNSEFVAGSLGSSISISRQIFWQISARSTLRYDHGRNTIEMVGASIERGIFGLGRVGISGTYNPNDQRTSLQFDFSYDLPFAGTRLSLRSDDGALALSQQLMGTVGYDGSTNHLVVGSRGAVGRGGITLRPFLDENNNGQIDSGEPSVENLEVRVNGGRVLGGNDGVVRIIELEPYEHYTVELSSRNLEYLTWLPAFKTLGVVVDANSFKDIPIPITVSGQVIGGVHRSTGGRITEQGGIRILLRSMQTGRIDSVVTFSNGEFEIIGLPAGTYQAYVDRTQLRTLGVASAPAFVDFTVRSIREGDFVDNVSFNLIDRPEHSNDGGDHANEEVSDAIYPVGYSRTIPIATTTDELSRETTRFLDSLAEEMAEHPGITIELQGRLSEGFDETDIRELLNYTYTIRTWLIDAGVAERAVGFRPPVPNRSVTPATSGGVTVTVRRGGRKP